MEEDMSITGEVARSFRKAEEGAPRRDILQLPLFFGGAGGTFYLRRWKNGDSRCHFRSASLLQPFVLDPLWQFWGILERRKGRVCSASAETPRCFPTISAG